MSNPATALHDVIDRVVAAETRLDLAWEAVLEAPFGSPEFVARHCEVVGLLGDTLRLLTNLPGPTWARPMKYVAAWWQALVMPTANWQGGGVSSLNLIAASDLDHLGQVGDLIDASLDHTAITPDSTQLNELKAVCEEWLTALDQFSDLPPAARQLMGVDLAHLVWLIDNVDTFGTARIARAAQAATTAAVLNVDQIKEPKQRKAWTERAQRLATTVTLFTTLVTAPAGIALEASAFTLHQLNRNVNEVADLIDGPDKPPDEVTPPARDAEQPTEQGPKATGSKS